MKLLNAIIAAAIVFAAASAHAGPRDQQAKKLFLEGNSLLKNGNYAGAVTKYRAAYAMVPNPKILHNLAVTLGMLGRHVAAADVYEMYLTNPKRNPHRVGEIEKRLRDLETKIGRVSIEVNQGGAHVYLDGADMGVSPKKMFRRVEPGRHIVTANKPGFCTARAEIRVAAGQERVVRFSLIPVATVEERPKNTRPLVDTTDELTVTRRAGKLGAYVRSDIDGNSFGRGAAVTAALAYNLSERLQLGVGGIFAASPGVYAGLTFSFGQGRLRPLILAGVPIQFADQTMVGVHAAAGVNWSIGKQLGLLITLGVEHFTNTPMNVQPTVFVPSVGLTWRL